MTRLTLAARAEFPLLARCVYLNSNSTGAVPRGVQGVLSAYWETIASWRDEVWERWWVDLHAYADALAAFIGAPAGSVVTDVNLSSLLGRLLGALDLGHRPRIVTTDLEFPTVPFLLRAQERRGAQVHVVRAADGARVDAADVVAAIDERTRLVCLSHASYVSGALVDLAPVVRRAHACGALVAVDAYQSVGVVPIDVGALDVDFLLAGAHKWLCGSIESAFLYAHPRHLATLEPVATGWMASSDPLSFGPARDYATSARRFASGTPAVLPALVSQVGLKILAGVGVEAIREASLDLTTRVLEHALDAGLEVVTPREPERRGGVVCVRFPGDAEAVAALKARGMVCSHRGGVRIAPQPLAQAARAALGPASIERDRDRYPWREVHGRLAGVLRGERSARFDWPPATPEARAAFEASMAAGCPPIAESFGAHAAAVFGERPSVRWLDVGGGDGTLAASLLPGAPHVKADVYNLPPIEPLVARRASAARLEGRLGFVAGDFLREPLPAGYDVLSFVRVLHDWPAETARALLEKAHVATRPGATVVVSEEFRTGDRLAVQFFWTYFLVGVDACVSRLREVAWYERVLREVGFDDVRVLPGAFDLVVARRGP